MTTNLTKLAETLSPNKRQLLELLLKEKKQKAGEGGIRGENFTRRKNPPAREVQSRPLFPCSTTSLVHRPTRSGTPVFNIPAAVRLLGSLNVKVLEVCFDEIVKRHEALRTSFAADDGLPVQVIAPTLKFEIPILDIRHVPEEERMAQVEDSSPVSANARLT